MSADKQRILEDTYQKAYSYESRGSWGAQDLETTPIGTVERGGRLYDLCVDSSGNYWYAVRIRTDRGPVPEREAIFGKRKIKAFQRRR